jgi:hypothetical protein
MESALDSTLASVVLKFYQAWCTDSRDKLYGLLSMASESDRSSIPVDYGQDKTAWDVLLDFWAHYVRCHPNTEEVQERRVIGLVWVLWSQMEIRGIPNRYRTCVRDGRNLVRVLGLEGFRVQARPLFRYRDPQLAVTEDGQWHDGLCNRKSLLDFRPGPEEFTSRETTSRRWLVISERLEPADICYLAEDQPASISWEANLETVPNQTMIIFRVNTYEFRSVGRGSDLVGTVIVGKLGTGS